MKRLVFLLIIIPGFIYSFTFQQLSDHDIPGISHSSIDWGDYDNDGTLDLLLTGFTSNERISRVYRNNGDGTFTHQTAIELPGLYFSQGLWGDYNNDGYLDIIISGLDEENQTVTTLYRNNGDGSFIENTTVNFPGIREGSMNWVDYNNNGWLDLFITGFTGTDEITRMYQNNGDGTFTWRSDFLFPGFRHVDSAWGDLFNNGYPDLIIAGSVGGTRTTSIYLNDQGTGFLLQSDTGIPDIDRGSIAIGDYNSDGLLDILITGRLNVTTRISRVYQNMGNGTFQQVANLTGIAYGEGIWADLSNNGLPDVVISGAVSGTTTNIAKVFLNQGDDTFNELPGFEPTGLSYSSLQAVDLINDGKVDIAITGMVSSTDKQFNIYLNQVDSQNSIPTPPTSLSSTVNSDHVLLQWDSGNDLETATNSLSYNVWIRPVNQAELQLMAPMSDLSTGFRRVRRPGNAGNRNLHQIHDLPAGYYQWRVQTIDSAYAGSPFSNWQSFYIPPVYLPAPENVVISEVDTQFYLSWDEVEEANLYRIYGTEDPYDDNWEILVEITETDWVVPIYHSRYFFRIVAVLE